MKIYIAGPMRGLPDWNRPAFAEAEQRWTKAGHQVFSPRWAIRLMGTEVPEDGKHDPNRIDRVHLNQAMQIDLACLYAADAIALLPGWERSAGVTVELALAQFLRLEVYHAVSMRPINPIATPWGKIRAFMGTLVEGVEAAVAQANEDAYRVRREVRDQGEGHSY